MATPPDKLNSRNVAHESAFEVWTDVVVVGDGDAPPLDETYLKIMLGSLVRGDTVATNEFSKPNSIGSWLIQPVRDLDLAIRNPLYSPTSAIAAMAGREAGPFRVESVVEIANVDVRREAEFAFRRRLGETGTVVDMELARVYNDDRR